MNMTHVMVRLNVCLIPTFRRHINIQLLQLTEQDIFEASVNYTESLEVLHNHKGLLKLSLYDLRLVKQSLCNTSHSALCLAMTPIKSP